MYCITTTTARITITITRILISSKFFNFNCELYSTSGVHKTHILLKCAILPASLLPITTTAT